MPSIRFNHMELTLPPGSLDEGGLQGMGGDGVAEPGDGGDGPALGGPGQHQATVHRLAPDEHRAGAAVALLAAPLDLKAAQLAQALEQGDVGVQRDLAALAVDLEDDRSFFHRRHFPLSSTPPRPR